MRPLQTLRPVYKFGEKDENTDNPVIDDAAREKKVAKAPPVEKPTVEKPAVEEPAVEEPAVEKPAVEEPVKLPPTSETIISKPSEAEPEAISIPRPSKPVFRPTRPPKPTKTRESRKTASARSKSTGSSATTAKGDLARGIRAGRLCVTELRSQLNRSSPPRRPDRLPTYRLERGNVLQVNKGAFRENARWINLKFRCVIDRAATTVVSFRLDVGATIPRSQWAARGLPGS